MYRGVDFLETKLATSHVIVMKFFEFDNFSKHVVNSNVLV